MMPKPPYLTKEELVPAILSYKHFLQQSLYIFVISSSLYIEKTSNSSLLIDSISLRFSSVLAIGIPRYSSKT